MEPCERQRGRECVHVVGVTGSRIRLWRRYQTGVETDFDTLVRQFSEALGFIQGNEGSHEEPRFFVEQRAAEGTRAARVTIGTRVELDIYTRSR